MMVLQNSNQFVGASL